MMKDFKLEQAKKDLLYGINNPPSGFNGGIEIQGGFVTPMNFKDILNEVEDGEPKINFTHNVWVLKDSRKEFPVMPGNFYGQYRNNNHGYDWYYPDMDHAFVLFPDRTPRANTLYTKSMDKYIGTEQRTDRTTKEKVWSPDKWVTNDVIKRAGVWNKSDSYNPDNVYSYSSVKGEYGGEECGAEWRYMRIRDLEEQSLADSMNHIHSFLDINEEIICAIEAAPRWESEDPQATKLFGQVGGENQAILVISLSNYKTLNEKFWINSVYLERDDIIIADLIDLGVLKEKHSGVMIIDEEKKTLNYFPFYPSNRTRITMSPLDGTSQKVSNRKTSWLSNGIYPVRSLQYKSKKELDQQRLVWINTYQAYEPNYINKLVVTPYFSRKY